jgi:hypothetical protein
MILTLWLADAHRAAATAKAHLPGNSPDATNYGKEAGAKIDNAVSTPN